MPNFFVRFQSTRDLSDEELGGALKGLALLREEGSILGWRLAHEVGRSPLISLEVEAESDSDAAVEGGMVFVEVLAAAGLEGQREVFQRGEAVTRA